MALAAAQGSAQAATQASTLPNAPSADQSANPAPVKKKPQAKSKAEFEAYKAAAAQTDPAKLEAAAADFAQKYTSSELRALLYEQAMGLYQQANNDPKSLEMARAVLKYDPTEAVTLLTAAQILAEHTHNDDLDRNDRLAEAEADAKAAMLHIRDIAQPPAMTPEQFDASMSQLRGSVHRVLGTVAFKRLDYAKAIKEFNDDVAEEKAQTDPEVWLRLALAYDKDSDYLEALDAAKKAISSSDAGSQLRQVAEKERKRLEELTPIH